MQPAHGRQHDPDMTGLAADIKAWARGLGFASLGIADTDLSEAEAHLMDWLAKDRHCEMGYMAEHGTRRSRPADLVSGTVRVLSVRLPYWPKARDAESVLNDPALGYVARYALGRDYHKVLRNKLQKLADRIESVIGPFGYRVFTDSAPVLEKALAEKAGLGWIGKHTNLIDKDEGSWFFLGEMYTDLPLPIDAKSSNHCGTCTRCIEICPTQAILAPYELDARRCISYLTIELHGPIPVEMRHHIGNRIFGCDDCQLVCPWNKYAQVTTIDDFTPRHGLDATQLIELFSWSEEEFL
ncbi:MAG: tRNA epoxyqueuosine(34) reductase QueG, partial [Pseudomonadota bacterium]